MTGLKGGRGARSVTAALLVAAAALPATPRAALPPPSPPAPLPEPAAAEPIPSQPLPPPRPDTPTALEPWPALLEEPDGTLLNTWLDLPHAFLERRIFGIVGGFDRFFADERDLGPTRSSSFIRWRNEVVVLDDGTLDVGTGLRADLSLPHVQRRLRRFRILLENAGRGLVASEPTALGGQQDGGRADAILRFSLLDTLRSSFDLGGGILFDLPPGVVGRVRFRYARELGPVALARIAATGFWNTRDGFGTNGSFALERALPMRLLLRWTNATLVSQVSDGYESGSELALLAKLSRRTAVTLLGSAAAASKPTLVVRTWRLAARLRTSLLRRWIFGEVEPEVKWPRYDDVGLPVMRAPGERRWRPALFLRLEIQFEEPSGA